MNAVSGSDDAELSVDLGRTSYLPDAATILTPNLSTQIHLPTIIASFVNLV